jgi:polyhydroxyalkanoate synthesis regulator phasin
MQMEEMMKHCCGEGGKPDPEKMKQFMESFGKKEFSEAQMEMIHEFCCGEGKPSPQEMKALMEKCGCSQPQTAKTESVEATSDEVKDLRAEVRQLKETLAELLIENRMFKKEQHRGG